MADCSRSQITFREEVQAAAAAVHLRVGEGMEEGKDHILFITAQPQGSNPHACQLLGWPKSSFGLFHNILYLPYILYQLAFKTSIVKVRSQDSAAVSTAQ